jgi:hypothetical protein
MTRPLLRRSAAALLLASASLAALAHGDVKCPAVPKAEWRPPAELAAKLKAEGWVIRRMEATPTCYEVYAKDPQGQRVEAFFHPKTLDRVE